jgi:hypothetical protein
MVPQCIQFFRRSIAAVQTVGSRQLPQSECVITYRFSQPDEPDALVRSRQSKPKPSSGGAYSLWSKAREARCDISLKVGSFRVDQIELLIERGVVDPATPEEPEHAVPFGGFLLQTIPEAAQFLLAALAFTILHGHALAQTFKNLAGVAEERLDVRPDQALEIIAVQAPAGAWQVAVALF